MSTSPLHLLVSRFNWPHPVWQDKSNEEYISWLQVRLDLFERYTLKSYQNLIVKPDRWLFLIDKGKLENGIIEKLSYLLKGEEYHFVEFNGLGVRESILRYLLDTYGASGFPHEVRTTRLDTDDLVSNDFFDRLKSVVLEDTSQLLISFPGGANYDIETGFFYYSSYPDNPFITLCQKTPTPNEFRSVYDQMHHLFYKVAQKNLYIRSYAPMWASCIHKGNLSNQALRQTNLITLSSQPYLLSRFGLEGAK